MSLFLFNNFSENYVTTNFMLMHSLNVLSDHSQMDLIVYIFYIVSFMQNEEKDFA